MTRLGVLTTSYPRWRGDYAGCFVADRVAALRARGASVQVLTTTPSPVSDVGVDGVTVTRVTDAASGKLFDASGAPDAFEAARAGARARLAITAAASTARLLAAAREAVPAWDELESHWLVPCGVVGALVAGARAHRAWAHGGDVALLERAPGGRAIARWLVRSGARLTFVSDELRVRFARLSGAGHGLEVAALPLPGTTPPRGEPRRGPRVVLGVGRLVPIKGFDLLVRAVGRVPRPERPAVVLLGDGPERERLLRLARGCDVRLEAAGTVPREEVPRHLLAADVCALTSRVLPNGRREGLPIVVREALALGRPVVATSTGGLVGLAGTPGLTLVPPEDPAALAHALRSVMPLTP